MVNSPELSDYERLKQLVEVLKTIGKKVKDVAFDNKMEYSPVETQAMAQLLEEIGLNPEYVVRQSTHNYWLSVVIGGQEITIDLHPEFQYSYLNELQNRIISDAVYENIEIAKDYYEHNKISVLPAKSIEYQATIDPGYTEPVKVVQKDSDQWRSDKYDYLRGDFFQAKTELIPKVAPLVRQELDSLQKMT